jgi:hypothetical protein
VHEQLRAGDIDHHHAAQVDGERSGGGASSETTAIALSGFAYPYACGASHQRGAASHADSSLAWSAGTA